MKTLVSFYVHLSHNLRHSGFEFVFHFGPKFIGSVTVLSLSYNTHSPICAHREIYTGSKGNNIINPPRGKHSSKCYGTFPTAYSGLSLSVLFNSYFPLFLLSSCTSVSSQPLQGTVHEPSGPSQRELDPSQTSSTSKERGEALPALLHQHSSWELAMFPYRLTRASQLSSWTGTM